MTDLYEPINLNDHASQFISEEGIYDVAITHCEKVYSAKATPGYKFTYKTAKNEMIQDTCFLTSQAMYRLVKLAQAAGLNENETKSFIPPMIIGRTIKIAVRPNEEKPEYMNVVSFMKSDVAVDPTHIEPPKKDDVPF